MKQYTWNFDPDDYWCNGIYETVEECIDEAKANNYDDEEIVYVGEYVPFEPCVDISQAVELLDGIYGCAQECGEIADDWEIYKNMKETEDLTEELNKVVQNWLEKHNHWPNFGSIENIKEYELKEED